jgi:uncharacterized membrane protein
MFKLKENDNSLAVINRLAKELSAKFTYHNLKKELTEHPDYPSMLALSDTLNSMKIKNLAVKIPINQLTEVPTPCIAALEGEERIFAVIESVKDNGVEWWHYEKGVIRQSIDDFRLNWKGSLILAEASDESIENNYLLNRRKEILRYLFQIISVAFCFTMLFQITKYLFQSSDATVFLFFICIKLIGLMVSILLLTYMFNENSEILRKICDVNEKGSCISVLQSKAATIWGLISWSEIGFFYFIGGLITLIIGLNETSVLNSLIYLNIIALPYTFYSIYYQKYIAKKWCVLCMTVQAILWLEFLVIIPYFKSNSISWDAIRLMVFSYGLPIALWYPLKTLINAYVQLPHFKQGLRRFQNNVEYFNHSLIQQQIMKPVNSSMPVIKIGNEKAKNGITLVINPFCSACSDEYTLFKSWIENNEELIYGQIVISNSNNSNDESNIFVKHLFSIDPIQQEYALNTWFNVSKQDFNHWGKLFPILKFNESASKIAQQHNDWSKESNIQYTPSLFINGFLLPELYSIEDVKRITTLIFI